VERPREIQKPIVFRFAHHCPTWKGGSNSS